MVQRHSYNVVVLLGIALCWCAAGALWQANAALMTCPDCKESVSSNASACPHCGCPANLFVGSTPAQPRPPANRLDANADTSVPVLVYDSNNQRFLHAEGVAWACEGGELREMLGTLIISPSNRHVVVDCNFAELITGNRIEIEIHLDKRGTNWRLYSTRGGRRFVNEPLPNAADIPFKFSFSIPEVIQDDDRVGFRVEFWNMEDSAHIKSVVAHNSGRLNRGGEISGYAAAPAEGSMRIDQDSFIMIETEKGGKGSGFLAVMGEQRYVVSNQHVIMGNRAFSVRTVGGERIRLTGMDVARDVDLVRFTYEAENLKGHKPLPTVESLPQIGDHVTVYGNSMGAGVVTRLVGSVLAVGPDRIEVSARFVPGNSGSPIIDDSGRVVAVATYVQKLGSDSAIYEGTRFNKVRRFGYLVTPNVQWVHVSPKTYYKQTAVLADVTTYYDEIAEAITQLSVIAFTKTYRSQTYRTGQTRTFVRGDYSKTNAKEYYNDPVWIDYLANFYDMYREDNRKPKAAESKRIIDRHNQAIVLKVKNMVALGEKALKRRRWASTFLEEWSDELDDYASAIKTYVDEMFP